MNEDLGLSKAAFGFASSLYFVAYFIFEVPSNGDAEGREP